MTSSKVRLQLRLFLIFIILLSGSPAARATWPNTPLVDNRVFAPVSEKTKDYFFPVTYQQRKKTLKERIVAWLRALENIRNPIEAYGPEGKVKNDPPLIFRWKYDQIPDRFVIRILDETTNVEKWESQPIPGSARSHSAALNPQIFAGSNSLIWQIEAYSEKTSTQFSVKAVQFFSFISPGELVEVQKQEAIINQWMKDRPQDEQLIVLLGTYYASQNMYISARDMFARFLKVNNPEQFSYDELRLRVAAKLEQIAGELISQQAALPNLPAGPARQKKLADLLQLSLLVFDYNQSFVYLDELITRSNRSDRRSWEQKKERIVNEQKFAEQVFPEDVSLNHAAVTDIERRARLTRQHIGEPYPILIHTADQDAGPGLTASLKLADKSSSIWAEADEEFLRDNVLLARPGVRTYSTGDGAPVVREGVQIYHVKEEVAAMIQALWSGNILRADPFIERSVYRVFPLIALSKSKYAAKCTRTPALDAAWRLIPEKRTRAGDLPAFNEFARILYPDPKTLNNSAVIKRRDGLIQCLSRVWDLTECDGVNDLRCRDLRKFYDVLLWRLSPVLELEITNRGPKEVVLNRVEVDPENFQSMGTPLVTAPAKAPTGIHVILDRIHFRPISRPLNIRLATGESAKTLIRLDSAEGGTHTLTIRIKNGHSVQWESKPFNLYFRRFR